VICPSCAAAVPPAVWKLVGAFVATPLAIALVVLLVVRRALARSSSDRGSGAPLA
jgi:hypothetical protein